MTNSDVTQILGALQRGEEHATEHLLPLVYEELRKLATAKLAHEKVEHTLQPTALVHEAYMRLVGNGGGWENRGHFFAAAAEAMRRILIEEARRRASLKRGGNHTIVALPDELITKSKDENESLLALDEALTRLEKQDSDSYKLVMLRYFSGLTVDEAAQSLGISSRTAKRYWSFARAWLQREIERQ
ncbi:RNA polymerase subunit sigma [Bremerella cremea]|uniref:RNA polymerase subunit sigma n=1 Tax=Bremerella cremea TaxID=1031537 RepID=A0A368KUD5_9BACT|nr:ECF-type sigma factor [Bremerella cremea]RCS54040.1 RNA polymerase subunit sigma [Bremerella cremea]